MRSLAILSKCATAAALFACSSMYGAEVSARIFDVRFDDTVKVTDVNGTEKSTFTPGEQVKVTVSLFGETVYKRFDGLPEEAQVVVKDAGDNVAEPAAYDSTTRGTVTATFTAGDKDVSLTAYTAPVWYWLFGEPTYYSTTNGVGETITYESSVKSGGKITSGMLSNRVWRLMAQPTNTGAKTLRIGGMSLCGYTDFGSEILDLSGPIVSIEGGNEVWGTYTIKEIGGSGWTPLAPYNSSNPVKIRCPAKENRVTDLVIPETMTSIGEKMFTAYGAVATSSLTNLIIASTNLKTIGRQAFFGSNLTGLTLKTPNLEAFPSDNALTSIALGGYDASNFELNSLTNFVNGGFSMTGISGVYRLPKLLLGNGVLGHPHNSTCSLEIGLGWTPEDHAVLKFKKTNGDNTPLARNYNGSVTFGPYEGFEGGQNTFFNDCGITNLVFVGAPFKETGNYVAMADFIGAAYKKATLCRIYVSKRLGWKTFVDPDPLSEKEQQTKAALEATLNEGEQVLGIFKDATNSRKGWLIHRASPYDPPPGGMILIIK